MKRIFSALIFLILFGSSTSFGQVGPEKTTAWKGFEKVEFTFQNTSAYYVKPKNPVAGNPWVWRAHFPFWHTEMDSILVSRGFHVAYVNTNDLFAHPKAMQVWDAFYDYLVKTKGFAPKVALEGVSRGGLYVYGWAKRNPDKVSCIYAEAPVCDPKSWPGGKGKGAGSPEDWALWLKLFGQTEQQALNFQDIPLNGLEGLASFKVPILHVVSASDKIVPSEENTNPLIENYVKLGGPASIYPMTRGEQTLSGHHFPIENPAQFADFIYRYNVPVQRLLPHAPYIEVNKGLTAAFNKFEETKKGVVAFLGGSITYNPGWRPKVAQYLQERFPETEFTFIAAGIPSLGSTPHAFRYENDVLSKGTPDLLFVESAVNDRTNGFSEKAQVRALEGVLRHQYLKNPSTGIVLMAFADPDKTGDFEAGKVPTEVTVHQKVARHYGASFINLAREVYDRTKAGEFSWKYDFKDLHPSSYGQEVYFQTIKELFKMQSPLVAKTDLPKPIDIYSYQKARYVAVDQAKKMNGFQVNTNWAPTDGVGTREGFVNVPMLVSEKAGSSFEFSFTGTAVGIAIVSGTDAGILSYRIDGKKEQRLDLFSQWSRQLHLPWYLMLSDELSPGKHTVRVEILADKNEKSKGNAARIVHFLVN